MTCESCLQEPFIGYIFGDKNERLDISERHEGWMFERPDMPCHGGLNRNSTIESDVGFYFMNFDNLESTGVSSELSRLRVYHGKLYSTTTIS